MVLSLLDFSDVLDSPTPTMNYGSSLDSLIGDACMIRNHDCMWAGHCGSKEHPADEPRHMASLIPPTPVIMQSPVAIKEENNAIKPLIATGQQSLLKPAVRAANTMLHSPQTPPMSDDEEIRVKPTHVLQLLHQAIHECDLDEDSDLCEYFEEEVEVVEPTISSRQTEEEEKINIRLKFAAESDHSYHKGKHDAMSMINLGIDTPSDSGKFVFRFLHALSKFCQRANNLPGIVKLHSLSQKKTRNG